MKIKKDLIYLTIIIALIGLSCFSWYTYHYEPGQQRDIAVYYNQDRPLNDEVIGVIRGANKFVYFGVYTFTKADIKDALLAAKYRGLKVVGITDTQQYETLDAQKSLINELRKADIPVYEQNTTGIMHMKAVVTDNAYASGSYNWTAAATNVNDEVLEVGHDETIRSNYQKILEELFAKYGSQSS